MDLENTAEMPPTTKQPRKVKDLGSLNKLLIRGLPDWLDADGVLLTYDLAKHLNVSYQAAYKWFERNRIPPKRIPALVKLSAESKSRPEGFEPLSADDFMGFLG